MFLRKTASLIMPMRDVPAGTAIFVGTARNCARSLPAALDRWQALATIFEKARFIVAENDSTDGTKEILEHWAATGPDRLVLTLDGLSGQGLSRSRALAFARNALLTHAKTGDADFLVVMDMDEASLAITPKRLRTCMAYQAWDALFANQLFYYDDVWALRDARRSPDDWVERVEQSRWQWLGRLRHLTWRNRPIWPWQRPLAVKSAFGGLGIYRLPLPQTAVYCGHRNGRDLCEHVPFNEALLSNGARLVLHPGLINMLPKQLYRLWKILGCDRYD